MPSFLAPLVDRVGGPRKALIIVVGLATALLIFGVSRWAAAPAWVPAFSNLPLEDVGPLAEKLTGAGFTNVDTGNHTGAGVNGTTVFYAVEAQKATADAVAQALGITQVLPSATEAAAGIAVVLEADYQS